MSTNHVSVRLDAETIARVDALAPQFSTEWRPATRSDVLRALILTALALHEAPDPPTGPPARAASKGGGEGRPGKSERDPR